MWVAGPAAAGILGDWGADVIKIEPPEGDPFRALLSGIFDGVNPPFELDNRNKRSVGLNLSLAEGRAVAADLVDRADVFVTNARPARARAGRPRPRDRVDAQPPPRLRPRHRLRPGGRGPRPRRLRRRRLLVAGRGRRCPHSRRHAAALPAGRHGRPHGRARRRRRGVRGALHPGAHRRGPARVGVAAAHRHVHDGMGHQHERSAGCSDDPHDRGRATQPDDHRLLRR